MAADPLLTVGAVGTSSVALGSTGCIFLSFFLGVLMVISIQAEVLGRMLLRGVSDFVVLSCCGVGLNALHLTGGLGGHFGADSHVHALLMAAAANHLCGAFVVGPSEDGSTVGMAICVANSYSLRLVNIVTFVALDVVGCCVVTIRCICLFAGCKLLFIAVHMQIDNPKSLTLLHIVSLRNGDGIRDGVTIELNGHILADDIGFVNVLQQGDFSTISNSVHRFCQSLILRTICFCNILDIRVRNGHLITCAGCGILSTNSQNTDFLFGAIDHIGVESILSGIINTAAQVRLIRQIAISTFSAIHSSCTGAVQQQLLSACSCCISNGVMVHVSGHVGDKLNAPLQASKICTQGRAIYSNSGALLLDECINQCIQNRIAGGCGLIVSVACSLEELFISRCRLIAQLGFRRVVYQQDTIALGSCLQCLNQPFDLRRTVMRHIIYRTGCVIKLVDGNDSQVVCILIVVGWVTVAEICIIQIMDLRCAYIFIGIMIAYGVNKRILIILFENIKQRRAPVTGIVSRQVTGNHHSIRADFVCKLHSAVSADHVAVNVGNMNQYGLGDVFQFIYCRLVLAHNIAGAYVTHRQASIIGGSTFQANVHVDGAAGQIIGVTIGQPIRTLPHSL